MRIWGLVGLFILAAITPGWAEDCSLKKVEDLPLTANADHVSLPVKFGTQDAQLEFNVGVGLSSLSENFAKAQNFKVRDIDGASISVFGVNVKSYAVAPDMHLGIIPAKNMQFMVLPADKVASGTVGSLETSLFDKADFELDLAHQRFGVFLPDHCPGQAVYWATPDKATAIAYTQDPVAGSIRSDMQLDGKDVRVALVTSGLSRMGMNAARDIFGLDVDSPGMTSVEAPPSLAATFKPDQKFYSYHFKSLSAGGIAISNLNLFVYDQPKSTERCDGHYVKRVALEPEHPSLTFPVSYSCYGGQDVIIGPAILAKLRLYFSTKEKLIYATAADAQ